ncbi:carbohydrate ABC transporter substrate-binding protein [Rhodophyticola sp. CCM32]|uniref:ABC transporter substrate-binding protein n=1 Tax=Rhodophyticola sp. CCM32 TaxID=2916397 RepID=UPI00107FC9B3|nr:ABC transporter substrate-binding protein [Rhodophyticola sp. CCM32]QBY00650.1 carbohydrate ABC transporter substrate-binding protein [Rhodophyticola sp. CCM32]
MKKTILTTTMLASAMLVGAGAVSAQEIRFMCSTDGNECDVIGEILDGFEAENPGVTVAVDVVPYQAILENLPVQLAAGTGPDIAKVTDLGGLHEYYLDLAPYVDRDYWQASFGDTLDWYRGGPDDDGIYGMHSQLTITGAYINRTLFDQAGIEVPPLEADWATWAEAARAVAEATDTPFPMAMDRSGHRIAGPAISYGAMLFNADGTPLLVDEGFTAYVQQFVDWHEDGTMARDVWAGQGGSTYQDAAQEFINGDLVYYYSGSWQVGRFDEQIGDFFDWQVVGSPCGTGGCTGMPGGAGIVGFEQTEHPEIVAAVIDYLAQEENYARLTAETRNIPAHIAVAEAGVEYVGASDAAAAALNAWAAQVPTISPIAFQYQGYVNNRAMFGITVERVSQAIVGELTVEQAMDRAVSDLAAVMAETQ